MSEAKLRNALWAGMMLMMSPYGLCIHVLITYQPKSLWSISVCVYVWHAHVQEWNWWNRKMHTAIWHQLYTCTLAQYSDLVYLHLLLSMSVCQCILGIHLLHSSCLLFYISIFFFCEDNVKYEVISESFFTKILLALGTNVLWWTSCDHKLLLLESLHM